MLVGFDDQFVTVSNQFPLGVASQVEIPSMCDAFEFTVFAIREEGEGVFDVSGPDGVVREFISVVVSENEVVAGNTQIDVPLVPAVSPVLVPLPRLIRVAEELHLHLLKLSGPEREVPRRDFIPEALTDLRDSEGNLDSARVDDVLEVDEHALSGFGSEERGIFFVRECSDGGLEHQVEFPRLGQLAGVVFAGRFTGFSGALAGGHMIGSESGLAFSAVDHHVVKQVVMSRGFPDLRMHDDRGFDTDHMKRPGGPIGDTEFVMVGDHVVPPRLAHIPFQLDSERSVVPESARPAIDFRRRENEPSSFAQRDDRVHGCRHCVLDVCQASTLMVLL